MVRVDLTWYHHAIDLCLFTTDGQGSVALMISSVFSYMIQMVICPTPYWLAKY